MNERRRTNVLVGAALLAALLTACGQQVAGTEVDGAILPAAVQTAVIDFEGLAEGAVVGALSSGNGISGAAFPGSVGVYGENGVAVVNAAMVFDATCDGGTPADCSGDDPDLYQPTLGNVLIVSEDLDATDPDDADHPDAELRFDFSGFGPGTFTVDGLTVLDVDDDESPEANIKVYDAMGGTLLATVDIPDIGDGNFLFVPVDVAGVGYLVVHLHGSGAVDNVRLSVPDEPREPEGCTPGYWRQRHHYDSWEPTGYVPAQPYVDAFGVGPTTPLGDAIRARGGGVNAFLRASTAALLNAAHPDLDYAYTLADLFDIVAEAFATDDFSMAGALDEANNAGCPLN